MLISEITKNIESTGWAITQTAFTTSPFASVVFTVVNATGAGGTAGILKLSVQAGVASDVAGNTNTATASDFVINTLIQVTLTNEYAACCVIGGNNELLAQTSPGQALTMPGQGTLTRSGYTFAGWSLETTNGSGPVVGATWTPTVPVKLYSSWTPNVYVVTYNANGGNGAPATASQNFTFGGTALVPSAVGTLNRTGYRFDGWSTTPVASGTIYSNPADTSVVGSTTKTYSPAASIILYAKWTALPFAVSFNANGGSGTKTNLAIVAGTASTIVTNTEITRTGFTFTGWNTAADNTGTAYGNTGSITAYSNVTLYAIWTIKAPAVPTVSAAAGNGESTISITSSLLSTSTNGAPASFTITALDSNGTALSPAKTCTVITPATSCVITGLSNTVGYKFSATATNAGGTSTAGAASTTVTPAGFGVTYNVAANGGTTGTASATFNAGTPLILPVATKAGYTFAGWYSAASGGTLIGLAGGTYSPTATAIVYATWTAISYTITYNGNGNTSGATPANGAYTSGGTTYNILGANTLVKTGYDFAGWNRSPS
jgi:uncharacterized repeat protein (TIGR02543 family)